ncbi:MAG TPA: type II CAAX endopeptidase family protein [Symbiobacteriaceae bacterium]|nr:type II CAAX endopeptidase family protein [Symbiobacteriaceae bacterium]
MTSTRRSWDTRYELLLFFVLTYALTIAATAAANYWTAVPYSLFFIPQVFSPTIIAVILTAITDGWEGAKKLLLRYVQWRVGGRWYVAAFALAWIPLLVALVYIALGNPPRGLEPGMTPGMLLFYLVYNLYAGPLSEEGGWRGYALPRLQKHFSALTSSLILGVIWSCWHLPFYMNSGGKAGIPFPAYLALVTVMTIFLTWLYNNTGGSLLLTMLAHFSFNAGQAFIVSHLGLLPGMVFNIVCSVGLTLLVVGIVIYYGPRRLVRAAPAGREAA